MFKKTLILLSVSFLSFGLITVSAEDLNATTTTQTNADTEMQIQMHSVNVTSTTSSPTVPGINFPTIPTPPTPNFPFPPFPGSGTSTWQWPPQWPPMPPTSPTSTSTVKVTIVKYVDGLMATASSSNNMSFAMNSNYSATNTGTGTGTYSLGPSGYAGNNTPYQAMTVGMTMGASYSTYEIMNSMVGTMCSTSTPFALLGYSTGNTLAQAMNAIPSLTAPSFTNLTTNKYVIVWNDNCATTGNGAGGQIGGDVTGGATTSTSTVGVLKVDSVEIVKSSAIANGTFTDGWKYIFNITVPTNELNLSMKFTNWMSNLGSSTIPVANNMRISSAQASSTATVLVTASNTYTIPTLFIVNDLNVGMAGKQIKVLVETAVPIGSINGGYTTTYGLKTE